MTPFGEAVRKLRAERGVSQKEMAEAIGVSAAYLSALEHGRRGKPSFDFLQRVAGYFHIIWDDAEALFAIADQSDPRVVIDTAGLSAAHTAFANRLSRIIGQLDEEAIGELDGLVDRKLAPLSLQK
ncbi:helix-turn-helix transcriptional regulator [Martelella lutilitoris]|uniref:Helix-turn-helix transcriptional regulator n=1 Tax=Martelella lutilitoris TaxID=2583532 RepID=A0A5C4JXA5_9HYPH|nr:helix-turn-helix transcriptional regulator [Martelella lutilitoris]TNB49936.1 helix-turn-helix transcriptional regulator [Martelella lutilitoris]